MEVKEHFDILNQGLSKWNRWRRANPHILPDLRDVTFKARNFCGANFRYVNFENANLEGIALSTSDLSYANLSGVKLDHANLKRTVLGETIFNKTSLSKTKFHNAQLRATLFLSVNLSEVEGLDQAHHLQSSTIDVDTIHLSKGRIPNTFLEGAGVPDTFIDYIRSLGKKPFDYHSCFISYTGEDHEVANRLHGDLRREGVRCWLAPKELKPGDPFPQVIEDAIRHYNKLIVILSTKSLKSGWVEREVNLALAKESNEKSAVLPIFLDDAYKSSKKDWVVSLRGRVHIGDFKTEKHYPAMLKRLLGALRA